MTVARMTKKDIKKLLKKMEKNNVDYAEFNLSANYIEVGGTLKCNIDFMKDGSQYICNYISITD